MTRRSVSLMVSGALIIMLVAVAAQLPVPYVVYSPGPVVDTLAQLETDDGEEIPVVQIDGADTYPVEGELDLTTVGVTSADTELDILTVLRAWLDDDRAVVPRSTVYEDDETAEESREQSAQQLSRSQETAKVAALRELGYEVPQQVVIATVFEGTPAEGALEPGDIIVSVDGTPIASPDEVAEMIREREPGDTVEIGIRRDGEEMTVTPETEAAEDGGHPVVGFGVDWGYELPVDITITIDDAIGGPSAGMIFALAIYDTMTEEPLIEGTHIAGTGEITGDGEVGPIGGIQQKIAAASDDGAELFLAPVRNCSDAVSANNGDMQVVPVENLADAIDAIETYTEGDPADLATCE
ncbi:YlbL family protein [Phytoactinopolyspora halotolerans]|uniref:PDZ domain-containing protein n=1 Tax=Phytoactinopolyspora halotolerans TaxID=1981512 RepID=A0A6L9SFV3_9ACTN|nr:PDZ domain-containing protein [Phytoactinopolyspora halotolerans]NEE04146.1 PDZ domain-containing protein [Phytoactinopolyspora halotolerans]